MNYSLTTWLMLCSTAATLALWSTPQLNATPVWTSGNTPSADMVALYQFGPETSATLPATARTGVPAGTEVTHFLNHPDLDHAQSLENFNFNVADHGSIDLLANTPFGALDPTSLAIIGNVRFRGFQPIPNANTKDMTIEAWLKWDDSATSSDLRLGTGDRAIRIIRDANNPSRDAVGFQGSHGVWRPHAAFTGWDQLPAPVLDGQWFHIALVIKNTGMHDHAGHWHYNEGSFAMLFINGKLLGQDSAAAKINISEDDEEIVFHGSDRAALWQTLGTSRVLIDEFTIWQRDFTNNGTVVDGLFANGRGGAASVISGWTLYE